jgi:hypothetical protein
MPPFGECVKFFVLGKRKRHTVIASRQLHQRPRYLVFVFTRPCFLERPCKLHCRAIVLFLWVCFQVAPSDFYKLRSRDFNRDANSCAIQFRLKTRVRSKGICRQCVCRRPCISIAIKLVLKCGTCAGFQPYVPAHPRMMVRISNGAH